MRAGTELNLAWRIGAEKARVGSDGGPYSDSRFVTCVGAFHKLSSKIDLVLHEARTFPSPCFHYFLNSGELMT